MGDLSRREVVRLAVGAGILAPLGASGQEPKKAAAPGAADPKLTLALENPELFMFPEMVTFKTSVTDPHTQHLEISPIKGSRLGYDVVAVPAGAMRIFRPDVGHDEFAKQGGICWACGVTKGKFQFKKPAALVMAVRDLDGTVRCYAMAFDFRC